MTRNNFTATARRTLTFTLTACALAAAFPHIGLAAPDVGFWKVDPTKSTLGGTSATLTIMRAEGSNPAAGSVIVISETGVYRVTSAATSEIRGPRQVDFANMIRTGDAVLIGTRPRSSDHCGFKCQSGLSELTRTVTFTVVKSAEQQIKDMLASGEQN